MFRLGALPLPAVDDHEIPNKFMQGEWLDKA